MVPTISSGVAGGRFCGASLPRLAGGGEAGSGGDAFEIICCDCGDDPGLGYSEVSLDLQLLREPDPVRAGFAAYVNHVELHEQPVGATPGGR